MYIKKCFVWILLVLLVVSLPISVAGCKKNIYGTYKFFEIEIEWSSDTTEEEKQEYYTNYGDSISGFSTLYSGFIIKFNSDNTLVLSKNDYTSERKWKLISDNTYVYYLNSEDDDDANKFKIEGNKLKIILPSGESNATPYIVFKK